MRLVVNGAVMAPTCYGLAIKHTTGTSNAANTIPVRTDVNGYA